MAKPTGNPNGRPEKYTPEELLNRFLDYIAECIQQGRFANTAGFRRYAQIPKSTYYDYEKKEGFSDTIEKIDDILEDETLNASVPPAEKIFYLKNKFGYKDKTEVENTNLNVNAEAAEATPELIEKAKKALEILQKSE